MSEENFAGKPTLPEGSFVNSEIRIVSYFDGDGQMMYGVTLGGSMNVAQALGLLVLGGIQVYQGYKETSQEEE